MASLSLSHRTFRKSHTSVLGVFKDVSTANYAPSASSPQSLDEASIIALKADGSVVVLKEETGSLPTPSLHPEATSDVIKISSGHGFNIALKSNGTVIGWGLNNQGQISIPTGLANVIDIAAGSHHCLALKSDGTLVIWGRYETGPLTYAVPTIPAHVSNAKITAISCGIGFCLALTDKGQVLAWGEGTNGVKLLFHRQLVRV